MKLFVLSALLGVALSARLDTTYLPPNARTSGGNGHILTAPPQTPQYYTTARPTPAIPILKYSSENPGTGHYNFEYETGNSIRHGEMGQLKTIGQQDVTVVHGSYSFVAPDGVEYTVTYVADENGFRASGAHLPTPPPIPDIIQRSLRLNAEQTQWNPVTPVTKDYIPPKKSGYSY